MTIKPKRHVLKAITWRIIATLTTFTLVWIFTGKLELALSLGVIEVILKLIFYYLHERAWYKFSRFGISK